MDIKKLKKMINIEEQYKRFHELYSIIYSLISLDRETTAYKAKKIDFK